MDDSTRRERIATAVFGSFAADPDFFTGDENAEQWDLKVQYRANAAVTFADALIRALDRRTAR